MQKLSGRVALVTGGASGIGKAIAERLAHEGAAVVITDIQSALGEEVASHSGFLFVQHDVSDEAQWACVVKHVQQRKGRLDILVNNAGILGPMDATDPEALRLEDWRKIFSINVEGVLLGCRAAIPALHASGAGSIINISSIAGLLATPYATAYGASKATVRHLTKSIAQHCLERKLKVRCNSVHPGDVLTPWWHAYAKQAAERRGASIETVMNEARSRIPMGDFAQPEDIAAAVLFLASDDSRHMTGAKLIVDGGLMHCDTYRPAVTADIEPSRR